jgi:hypothetical protein
MENRQQVKFLPRDDRMKCSLNMPGPGMSGGLRFFRVSDNTLLFETAVQELRIFETGRIRDARFPAGFLCRNRNLSGKGMGIIYHASYSLRPQQFHHGLTG